MVRRPSRNARSNRDSSTRIFQPRAWYYDDTAVSINAREVEAMIAPREQVEETEEEAENRGRPVAPTAAAVVEKGSFVPRSARSSRRRLRASTARAENLSFTRSRRPFQLSRIDNFYSWFPIFD